MSSFTAGSFSSVFSLKLVPTWCGCGLFIFMVLCDVLGWIHRRACIHYRSWTPGWFPVWGVVWHRDRFRSLPCGFPGAARPVNKCPCRGHFSAIFYAFWGWFYYLKRPPGIGLMGCLVSLGQESYHVTYEEITCVRQTSCRDEITELRGTGSVLMNEQHIC